MLRGLSAKFSSLLYVSALFAVVLSPAVRATTRLRIGRWRPFQESGAGAIFVLVLAVALFLVAFCSLAFPPIIRDLQGFSGEMPGRLPDLLSKPLRQVPFCPGDIDTGDIVISSIQNFATQGAGALLALGKKLGRLARPHRRRLCAYALFPA